MTFEQQVRAVIHNDPVRWRLLAVVRELALPDAWIGAGFVRNAVWDHLHGRASTAPDGDVDVLWFDRSGIDPAEDLRLEARLLGHAPQVLWSVKNQARMHLRNGQEPYASTEDAMRYWPETATAVAVRRTADDRCEVLAPLGLDDLFGLRLRSTPGKAEVMAVRARDKGWLQRWSRLRSLG
ncbi:MULTISPECIES: nucleotidyltransferase family protein [unclassified Pseudomonas]|uniref:nucleotidyltransferase family protein n=1 Tax=unclassified Pseudomonas TaxID=196821 RepID=UPI002447E6C5|nr:MULTISPECIES: nucleotidyltransferase family protein [unclassified Pseudomonas]MDH0304739.1 nucleotidyltransferase family protein [Pseudomonas sp. GD04091]MDH1988177.1 nucleotidyltransferase family protein [Pseudomonas sp. GD03689]